MDRFGQFIRNIDWRLFHFLRPAAFYLLIPMVIVVLILALGNRERGRWKKIIPSGLRPYLFTKGSGLAMLMPLALFALGISLSVLALAGPTWKKKDIPGSKVEAVVLIALDLSRSMLATDIPPSRLERAKYKISDFLDANPRARAGLVAFAGTAHPVLPFTGDYQLIRQQTESLVPRIMPVAGTDLEVLLEVIDTLMRTVRAPSTILLMTDVLDADQVALLGNYMQGSPNHLEVLLFSTPNGAAIPGHGSVVSKQEPGVLTNFAGDTSVTITPLTLDKSDVEGIARRIAGKLIFETTGKRSEKEWEDMGWMLLMPALLITLLWYRRGWVIQWCIGAVIVGTLPSCGVGSRHPDWWYTRDYQGQQLEDAGRYEEAADRFDSGQYKAVAFFKAGDYEAAAELFAMDNSPAAIFNRGLALARLGRYDEALKAFGEAGSIDSGLKARVLGSITKVRQARQRADSILKYDQQSVSDSIKKTAKGKGPLKERKPQGEDEQLSSDTRVDKLPKSGDRATDEAASNIHMAKEAKTPPKDMSEKKPESFAEQILMRQTGADPAEFLHRRFELQEKRYYRAIKKTKEPW